MRTCKECKYVSYIKGNYKDVKNGCYICNIYGRSVVAGVADKCQNFKRR